MRVGILAVMVSVVAAGCAFDGPHGEAPDATLVVDAPTEVTVGFAAGTSITDEMEGMHSVPVVLSGPPTGLIRVNYKVTGGSATPNVDFVLADGTLMFDGTNEQDIQMEILKDMVDEPDEEFTIVLDGPEGALLGLAMHHVTISANTVPRINFATSALSISETVTASSISVSLDKISTVPISVKYAVVPTLSLTPATGGGVDYTLAAGTLVISAGTLGSTIPLAIVNDALDEDDEDLQIQLSMPTNAVLGPTTLFTYTILDEDLPPTVQFGSATTSLSENAGGTTIPVTLSAPSGKTITVAYTATLGTASTSDVAVAGGTLTFAPGDTTKSIPVSVTQDTLDEDDETFTLALTSTMNATLGTITSDLVTIIDDDPTPTVSITTANMPIAEGMGSTVLTVTLSAASSKTVTVSFAGTGTATETADYSYAPSNHTLTFPPGIATPQTITVSIVEDSLDEPDETLITTLASPVNATVAGSPNTLTIIDDDPTCFGPSDGSAVCFQTVPATPVTLPNGNLNTDSSPLCSATQAVGWTTTQAAACFVIGTQVTQSGTTTVIGSRPLVVLATGAMTITGTIDGASHQGGTQGPASGSSLCKVFSPDPIGTANGGGGGAGASFMSAGGNGGGGDNNSNAGGSSTGADGIPPLVLRGGCDGQRGAGGGAGNQAGNTGKGGGVIYLVAGTQIDLTLATLNASGGGSGNSDKLSGGSGGGSGGMIKLFAPAIASGLATKLLANGGGGGAGVDNSGSGNPGTDPSAVVISMQAAGGSGSGGGPGGAGYAGSAQAVAGGKGGNNGHGGGGGGGGGGFIQSSQHIPAVNVSAGALDIP